MVIHFCYFLILILNFWNKGCQSICFHRRFLREDTDLEVFLKLPFSLELSDAQARDIEERVSTTETKNHMIKKPQAKVKQKKTSYKGEMWVVWGGRYQKADCPTKERECEFCSKLGHYKAVCWEYAKEKTKKKNKPK